MSKQIENNNNVESWSQRWDEARLKEATHCIDCEIQILRFIGSELSRQKEEIVKEINDKWLSLDLRYSRTPKEIDAELEKFGLYMQKVSHEALTAKLK